MNRVVKILMERDGETREVAEARVRECRDELVMLDFDELIDYDDIIADYLGLEPDYLDDILAMN